MEEEKKNWIEKLSKEELMEDIQREFATDARNGIGCGVFLLLLLVVNVVDMFSDGNWYSNGLCGPAVLFLLFIFDIWWKKKMSKCEDAHQLVDMYVKYDKAYRIFGFIIAIALELYICYNIYSYFGKVSMTRTLIYSVVAVAVAVILVWALFHKGNKKPVEKEIDRLRELNAQE